MTLGWGEHSEYSVCACVFNVTVKIVWAGVPFQGGIHVCVCVCVCLSALMSVPPPKLQG